VQGSFSDSQRSGSAKVSTGFRLRQCSQEYPGKESCLYENVVKEINDTIKTFMKVEIVHEGRAANVDADRLAGRHVWFCDLSESLCTSYSDQ
jgi:hypothetical protein